MFWTPTPRILRSAAAAICIAALAACTENNIPSGAHYIVSAPHTQFYKFGPAQAGGSPDFQLSEGTKVIMLEHAFGYSRVMTADGTAGWVPTEDMKPAPAGPFTTSKAAESNYTVQMNRPMFEKPKHSDVQGGGGALFDQNDTPLPQNTPPPPRPGFHF